VFLRVFALASIASLAWCQTLEQAKRAFDAGNYAAAAQLFEKANRESPRCDTLFFLGLTRYRLKQVDSALIAFGEAVQCDPKMTMAYLALGEAYTEKGNDNEALTAYEHAVALEPRNAAALRGAAFIYTRENLNEKAAATLETLVKVDPADPQAHADLGGAYFSIGQQDSAEKEFQETLRLKPNFALALLGLGNVYLRRGDQERAIEVLRRLARLLPNTFEPRFLLGSAYNRLGRYQEAVTELEAALRLGGAEYEVYYHLARAYGGLGRQEDRRAALAKFAELSKKSKEDAEAKRNAAKLIEQASSLVTSGDLPAALARMEQARELRPSDDTILFRIAGLNYDMQRYDIARNYVQEALALAPSEWLYHYLGGLIETRSAHPVEARKSLEIAVRLNPKAADAHNALGQVAEQQGDFALAIASFQKAAELDPRQEAYRLNLEGARRAAASKR